MRLGFLRLPQPDPGSAPRGGRTKEAQENQVPRVARNAATAAPLHPPRRSPENRHSRMSPISFPALTEPDCDRHRAHEKRLARHHARELPHWPDQDRHRHSHRHAMKAPTPVSGHRDFGSRVRSVPSLLWRPFGRNEVLIFERNQPQPTESHSTVPSSFRLGPRWWAGSFEERVEKSLGVTASGFVDGG